MDEFSQHVLKENNIHYSYVIDVATSIVELHKWEMEVDAFMGVYKEKKLEHCVQIQTLQK